MSRDEKLVELQNATKAWLREFGTGHVLTFAQVGDILRLIHERLMRVEAEIERYNDGLKGQM